MRFRADAGTMTDHGIIRLSGKAEIELAPDGRHKWVVPEGPTTGDTIYIEADKIEKVIN